MTLKALVDTGEYYLDKSRAKTAFDFTKISVNFRDEIWQLLRDAKEYVQAQNEA